MTARSARVFWLLILGLSLINFGTDLIIAGNSRLSGYELMIMTGSWLSLGGIAILTWLIISRQ